MEPKRVAKDATVLSLYRRALAGSVEHIHLFFAADVLDRYRARTGFTVQRTDTAGRLKRTGSWTLEFGIAPGDTLIHIPAGDLASALPDSEREHWLEHLVHLPHSANYLRMQSGSCSDDGETRSW